MNTPRVDALIHRVMAEHPGVSAHAQAVYYEAVHQELAPLARALELETAGKYDLIDHLQRQQDFSLRTFGPGMRTAGLIDHIKKELGEIEEDPTDVTEWIDVMLLAMDGAWRAGYDAQGICQALKAKLERNMARTWPDWRSVDPTKAIEHVSKSHG